MKTMLVRTQGGDVIRREIAVDGVTATSSTPEARPKPVLYEDEVITWPLGEELPLIIKAK